MQVLWSRDEIASAAKDAGMLKETNHEKLWSKMHCQNEVEHLD